jgi:hypothetical protein
MKGKNITEDFLHYIWKSRLYSVPLRDMDEEVLEIIDHGQHNHDAGPDFFNARIRYGGIEWAGNVELHLKASDWYLHGHHHDPAYNNVILHVVLEADCMVNNERMEIVPTACLYFHTEMYQKYSGLIKQQADLPCMEELQQVDMSGFELWLGDLLEERFREKLELIGRLIKETRGNHEEVMYRMLARAFGQQVNSMPFDMLAQSLPFSLLKRYKKQIIHLEAIMFGQAGLLPEKAGDNYTRILKTLYGQFQTRHKLKPMEGHLWKFLRLRPMNFPGIRISQLAYLLNQEPDLIQYLITEDRPWEGISGINIQTSPYWEDHYIFGKTSKKCKKKPGKNFTHRLIINAILPVHFTLGKFTIGNDDFSEWKDILTRMPAEKNHTVNMWKSLGIPVKDAFNSQALIQLTNKYCKFKRCLSCYVGSQIIQSSHS